MAFSLFGKNDPYLDEYKRFKKALERNPGDQGLKAQFFKFCMMNRFTTNEAVESHITEALNLFPSIEKSETFDLQSLYLAGKYYQEMKDNRKAYQVYLNAVRKFNDYVVKNPDHKSDYAEMAYSIALNLMALQLVPSDPELERCFKLIHKSYPLHVKRFEFENEMAKPAPDKAKAKQLIEEIKKLKAEAEKEVPAAPVEKAPASTAAAKAPAVEKEDIFTKLFRVPSLDLPEMKSSAAGQNKHEKEEKKDVFKMSPVELSGHGASYMVFQNNNWAGPFTLAQLRAAGSLDPDAWVCRVGSQLVSQAHEVSDLHSLIQHQA